MAKRSKALRLGRNSVLWAWVQIPLLTKRNVLLNVDRNNVTIEHIVKTGIQFQITLKNDCFHSNFINDRLTLNL